MSARERRRIGGMLVVAALAGAGLIVLTIVAPKQAAAGWLIGFLFWSQIPIGCLVLSMIHTLTGGRWGLILRPVLVPATAALPWLFIAIIPVFIAIPVLYPWTQPIAAVKPDVAAHYLNTPFFIARSVIALAIWSALAILIPRAQVTGGLLTAGIGLALYGITVSSVAIDWFLSLEPPFVSSSFGASVGVMQLITATAWAALLAPEPEGAPVVSDIGGLLLAFVLGITYLDFMALLVVWYGDLPSKTFWFVERDHLPWSAIAVFWFLLGSIAPILALLLSRVRRSRAALRTVSASVLVGSLLYTAYLIAPPFGVTSLIAAVLAVIVIGALQFVVITGGWLARMRGEAPAHGY
jgi:hypothetical protein